MGGGPVRAPARVGRCLDRRRRVGPGAEDGVRVLVAAQTTRAWLQACSDGQRLAVAQESLALAQRSQALTVD
ncbi:hypothetical protein M1B35_23330, partial [Pseudomonas sp. MAFF 302046]